MRQQQTLGWMFSLAVIANFSIPTVGQAKEHPEVIYGEDSRRDLYELTFKDYSLQHLARSTAILTYRSQIEGFTFSSWKKLKTMTLQESQNVCAEERFSQQPSAGWCTGFLVKDDILVTAGHCVAMEGSCENTAIVFDYAYRTEKDDVTLARNENIYYCKEVLHQKYDTDNGADFAILKLDRRVIGRKPLQIRKIGKVQDTTSLTVIGHPLGLPIKIAENAYIRDNSNAVHFETNTDTFGGNSGSPIFNQYGLVEGVLVRGERDFEFRGDCFVSKRCDKQECRGEDALRTTVFSHLIP